jgi:hypothetical protein
VVVPDVGEYGGRFAGVAAFKSSSIVIEARVGEILQIAGRGEGDGHRHNVFRVDKIATYDAGFLKEISPNGGTWFIQYFFEEQIDTLVVSE